MSGFSQWSEAPLMCWSGLYLYQPLLLMAQYHSLLMVWAASAGGCIACMVYDEDGVALVTALLTNASVLSKCAMASASRAGGGGVRPTKGCDDWVDE
jgi:hypothetical protein